MRRRLFPLKPLFLVLAFGLQLASAPPVAAAPPLETLLRACLGGYYEQLTYSRQTGEIEEDLRLAEQNLRRHNGLEERGPYAEALAIVKDRQAALLNRNAKRLGNYYVIPSRYAGEHISIPERELAERPYLSLRDRFEVRYFTEAESRAHRLEVKNGRFVDSSGRPFDTRRAPSPPAARTARALIVMDEKGTFYATLDHEIGRIHHSSLLAGRPVAFAGEAGFEDGVLTFLNDHSGHYMPDRMFTGQAIDRLKKLGIDVSRVRLQIHAEERLHRGRRTRLRELRIDPWSPEIPGGGP